MAAEKHELTDQVALDLLDQDAWSLHKELRGVDFEIGGQIRAHAQGHYDAGETITRLQSLYDTRSELMYKAGRLSVLREQVEERIQAAEQGERDRVPEEPQMEMAPAAIDHLDWMNLAPDAAHDREPDLHPHLEGERRMLAEMDREAAEEDHEWWRQLER